MKISINKGFTLLEILLVIAAIGILASIVIVAINPLRQLSKAENASRWSNINTIQKALDQYYIANGKYPDEVPSGSYEEVCDTGGESVGGDTDCITTGKIDLRVLVPAYIAEIPRDPNGGGYKVGINPLNNQISVWADKAKIGDLVAINPMEITLSIQGNNIAGQILEAILGNIGLNIPAENIIWYTVTGGVETQVGTGTSYTVQEEDLGKEIVSKVVMGGTSLASGSGGITATPIVLTSGDKDPAFDTGVPVGFDNEVITTAIQSDGKVIVAGWFNTYKGVEANYIVRLNSDGTIDNSFNIGTGFNNLINSIIIQSDDKILLGGSFTTYQGLEANGIVRLNSDGTRDNGFNIGAGFVGRVYTTAIQSDGKVIVGGDFIAYQGVSANRILRLNSDGSRDTSFNMGANFSSVVLSTAIQEDGDVIVGGLFTTYQVEANYIVRLNGDGTRDNSFNIGTGFSSVVLSTAIQEDGDVIIGGQFVTYQGVSANHIVRLNSDGSRDTSFDIGTGFNGDIRTTAIQSDGKVIVGGAFTTYQGLEANGIVRLNSDGTRDNSFNIGTGFNGNVNTTAIQSDGKVIVGGWFQSYKNEGALYLIRIQN